MDKNTSFGRIRSARVAALSGLVLSAGAAHNFSKLVNSGVATVLDWKLGSDTNLKWIQSYRQLHWDAGMDLDGSPESVLATSFDMIQHQTSEELQLNGVAIDNRLNYALGAYYFQEAGHLHDFVTFPMGILMIDGPNDLATSAEALYAHLNFKLTDQWALTLGGRETREHKEFQGYQTDDNGLSYKITGCFPPGAPNTLGAPAFLNCQQTLGFPVVGSPYTYYPTGPFHQNFSNFSPTVGVDFHINSDMMLYASYSKGYKTGSWTTRLWAASRSSTRATTRPASGMGRSASTWARRSRRHHGSSGRGDLLHLVHEDSQCPTK